MTNEIATMEEIMEENTDKMIAAFTKDGGLDYLLADVDEAVDCFQHDMSTKASRARTATLSNKVVKVKSKVEEVRKVLTKDHRAKIKKIDGYGKIARDHLVETKIRARKPLTDWENEEKDRVEKLELQIYSIISLGKTTSEDGVPYSIEILKANLEALGFVEVTEEIYGDKELEAFKAKKFSIDLVANAIAREEERIAQEEELNRLRAAEAKRVAKELEEKRIAKEEGEKRVAKERENKRKEEQAAHDKQVADDARQEAEKVAEQAKIDAENAKQEAKEAREKAEADRVQMAKDQQAGIQRAKDEAAAESLRQQQEAREEVARQQKEREENEKHVSCVIGDAVAALMDYTNLHTEDATDVIHEIRLGRIPNVSIRF